MSWRAVLFSASNCSRQSGQCALAIKATNLMRESVFDWNIPQRRSRQNAYTKDFLFFSCSPFSLPLALYNYRTCTINMPNNSGTSFSVAYHSPRRELYSSGATLAATSAATSANLLSLESAFYQPKRWQSWYVKKLTVDLSIARHRASKEQSKKASPLSQFRFDCQSHQSPHAATSPTRPSRSTTMIKAMHQFSTIRTTYSEDQKSYISQVNPKRAMLVQVDFEVFGEVSGLSVYLLFALLSLLSLLPLLEPFHCSRQ